MSPRKIFGETQHHDIRKTKSCNAQFVKLTAIVRGGSMFFQIAQANGRLIPDESQQFNNFSQSYLRRVKGDKHFLFLKISLGFYDTTIDPVEVL